MSSSKDKLKLPFTGGSRTKMPYSAGTSAEGHFLWTKNKYLIMDIMKGSRKVFSLDTKTQKEIFLWKKAHEKDSFMRYKKGYFVMTRPEGYLYMIKCLKGFFFKCKK